MGTPEQLAIKNVGKQGPKRHLEEHVDVLMTSNIVQCLGAMLNTVVFKWICTDVSRLVSHYYVLPRFIYTNYAAANGKKVNEVFSSSLCAMPKMLKMLSSF